MNNFKFLLSICVGMLFYVLISVFAGRDGVWAYNQLSEHKNVLSLNLEKVRKINETLKLDYVALDRDVGIITSRARELGYIYEGENLVKINGLQNEEASVYDTGAFVQMIEISYVSEKTCKLIGLIGFLLTLTLSFLTSVKKYSKNRLRVVSVATSIFDEKL